MLDLLKAPKAAAAVSTSIALPAAAGSEGTGIVYVGLRKIADNPYQPRGHYDAEHILNLALSIKRMKPDLPQTRGLQQLPMARVVSVDRSGLITVLMQGMYVGNHARQALAKTDAMVELMFGHSRLRAFMLLAEGLRALKDGSAIGLDLRGVGEIETRFAELQDADLDYIEMPMMLGFALDHQMWAHAITENSQRKNITAIEEAQSLQRAMDEFGLTMEEAGKPFGYARSTAANKVRLLSLPKEVQQAIATGELSERHGRELVRLAADPVRLKAAADAAIKKGQTVRQLQEDVNWKEKELKGEQAKMQELGAAKTALAAGWTLPGQTAPVGVEKLVDLPYWKLNEFDQENPKHAALICGGHCGPHCACFVVGYTDARAEGGYRPDPERAPHVCVACTNSSERHTKINALGALLPDSEEMRVAKAEAAEMKRQAQLRNDAAHVVWQRWLNDVDKAALWGDIRFWRVVGRYHYSLESIFREATDAQGALDLLLQMLYRRTKVWDPEIKIEAHAMKEVQALIRALGGNVAQEEEPTP